MPGHWSAVRAGLLATLAKFEDADLAFRPFDGSFSVAQVVLHIAHEERGEVQNGTTRALAEWPTEFDAGDYPSVDALRLLLASVHERTEAYLSLLADGDLARTVETPWGTSAPLVELLGHVIEHEVHHRGELSLVLRMLGREGLDA